MRADPLLLTAGEWLGVTSAALLLLTLVAFVVRWGIRFRLVGVTSFTVLLSLSCLAFAVSYTPRQLVDGAVSVPVVFDNGTDLVVAAATADLDPAAFGPSVQQVALNLRGSGRGTQLVEVRLRRVDSSTPGTDTPVVLATAIRNLADGREVRAGTALFAVECDHKARELGALSGDEGGRLTRSRARGDHVVDDECAAGEW